MTPQQAAKAIREGSPFLWQPDRPDADGNWYYMQRNAQLGRVYVIYRDGREELVSTESYGDRDALAQYIECFFQDEA